MARVKLRDERYEGSMQNDGWQPETIDRKVALRLSECNAAMVCGGARADVTWSDLARSEAWLSADQR